MLNANGLASKLMHIIHQNGCPIFVAIFMRIFWRKFDIQQFTAKTNFFDFRIFLSNGEEGLPFSLATGAVDKSLK